MDCGLPLESPPARPGPPIQSRFARRSHCMAQLRVLETASGPSSCKQQVSTMCVGCRARWASCSDAMCNHKTPVGLDGSSATSLPAGRGRCVCVCVCFAVASRAVHRLTAVIYVAGSQSFVSRCTFDLLFVAAPCTCSQPVPSRHVAVGLESSASTFALCYAALLARAGP